MVEMGSCYNQPRRRPSVVVTVFSELSCPFHFFTRSNDPVPLYLQVQKNGEYIEECYCSQDHCNAAPGSHALSPLPLLLPLAVAAVRL